MFNKKLLLPIFILILSLSLIACTKDMVDPDIDPEPNIPVVEGKDDTITDDKDSDVSTNNYASIKIKAEDAYDIYMKKYPNSKVEKIQIDNKKEGYIYKVKGFEENKEYELKINSMDGTIIKESMEIDDDMDNMEITRANVEKIEAIVNSRLSEFGENAELDEWTLEFDDGRFELEIEIDRKGFDDEERTYDIETGELLEIDD